MGLAMHGTLLLSSVIQIEGKKDPKMKNINKLLLFLTPKSCMAQAPG